MAKICNCKPEQAFPPGEFIREELEVREWSPEDLAEMMAWPLPEVEEVIRGERPVTQDIARELGRAFGVDPEYWLYLESAWQEWRDKQTSLGSGPWLVIIYRDDPQSAAKPLVTKFDDEAEARTFFARASEQWSDSYLARVVEGPKV